MFANCLNLLYGNEANTFNQWQEIEFIADYLDKIRNKLYPDVEGALWDPPLHPHHVILFFGLINCLVYNNYQGSHSYVVGTFLIWSISEFLCFSVSQPVLIGCEKSRDKFLVTNSLDTNLILDN